MRGGSNTCIVVPDLLPEVGAASTAGWLQENVHGGSCTTLGVARGIWANHGAHGTCTSHCRKHGGGRKMPCFVAGCTTNVTTNSERKGLCAKHGGGPGECVFGG